MFQRGSFKVAHYPAVGQLLTYSYLLYEERDKPALVALFSEPVGDAYLGFLEAHGVASVWRENGAWRGSLRAVEYGLADTEAKV